MKLTALFAIVLFINAGLLGATSARSAEWPPAFDLQPTIQSNDRPIGLVAGYFDQAELAYPATQAVDGTTNTSNVIAASHQEPNPTDTQNAASSNQSVDSRNQSVDSRNQSVDYGNRGLDHEGPVVEQIEFVEPAAEQIYVPGELLDHSKNSKRKRWSNFEVSGDYLSLWRRDYRLIDIRSDAITGFRVRVAGDLAFAPYSDHTVFSVSHVGFEENQQLRDGSVTFQAQSSIVNLDSVISKSHSRPFDLITGLRYTRLGNRFNALSNSAGGVDIELTNHLFGAHVGGRFAVQSTKSIQMTGYGVVGGAFNEMRGGIQDLASNAQVAGTDSEFSPYWDTELGIKYQATKILRLGVGFRAMAYYEAPDLLENLEGDTQERWLLVGLNTQAMLHF